jgi:hypothetical protein
MTEILATYFVEIIRFLNDNTNYANHDMEDYLNNLLPNLCYDHYTAHRRQISDALTTINADNINNFFSMSDNTNTLVYYFVTTLINKYDVIGDIHGDYIALKKIFDHILHTESKGLLSDNNVSANIVDISERQIIINGDLFDPINYSRARRFDKVLSYKYFVESGPCIILYLVILFMMKTSCEIIYIFGNHDIDYGFQHLCSVVFYNLKNIIDYILNPDNTRRFGLSENELNSITSLNNKITYYFYLYDDDNNLVIKHTPNHYVIKMKGFIDMKDFIQTQTLFNFFIGTNRNIHIQNTTLLDEYNITNAPNKKTAVIAYQYNNYIYQYIHYIRHGRHKILCKEAGQFNTATYKNDRLLKSDDKIIKKHEVIFQIKNTTTNAVTTKKITYELVTRTNMLKNEFFVLFAHTNYDHDNVINNLAELYELCKFHRYDEHIDLNKNIGINMEMSYILDSYEKQRLEDASKSDEKHYKSLIGLNLFKDLSKVDHYAVSILGYISFNGNDPLFNRTDIKRRYFLAYNNDYADYLDQSRHYLLSREDCDYLGDAENKNFINYDRFLI